MKDNQEWIVWQSELSAYDKDLLQRLTTVQREKGENVELLADNADLTDLQFFTDRVNLILRDENFYFY